VDHQDNTEVPRTALRQFLNFNIIGIVNTALAYGVYAGLVALGAGHYIALVGDYVFGIVFGFFMNKRFTFAVTARADWAMMGRMVLTYASLLLFNIALLWVLVDHFGWNKYLAQALALVVVVLSSFATQKLFVFRKAAGHHGT
jgi:putative flippase GtrA